MASVTVDACRKAYGAVSVLHGIDLRISDGEFVVLIGPSGCGKSTALRIVAGLEAASSGSIAIGGRRMDDVPPKDRNIAMVFQSYALYPQMTVRRNMAFSLRLRRWSEDRIGSAVGTASSMLGLSEYLQRFPRELSGGQRQRVAMGRALVRSPDVFLFDEPLSNLDAKLRAQMRVEIKKLHQELKTTTIYVTHDQIEAMTLADRIVVMNGGRIEQVGTPRELYDRPANTFVASFLGSPTMNLINARLAPEGLRIAGSAIPHAGGPAQEVVAGIRPEHLRLASEGIPAIVDVVEFTGPESQIHVTAGHMRLVLASKDSGAVEPGQHVFVMPERDRIHLFSAATGARLVTPRATN